MKSNRFKMNEITPARIVGAAARRVKEFPHWWAWHSQVALHNKGKIIALHSKHRKQRCFIIANGPSLKTTDLSLLKDEFTIGLNRIYLLFDKIKFQPTYYICVNELVIDQFYNEIDRIDSIKFINWRCRQYFSQSESLIFLKERLGLNDIFQTDLTKPTGGGGTVTYTALQLAYYLGFQEVILLGLDHYFEEKGRPSKTEVRIGDTDQSHFDPNYFPKGTKWQLPDLKWSEFGYKMARSFYERNGRAILDATINGHCNVFEKTDYYKLFAL